MFYLPRLWFGVSEPVGRSVYAVSGAGLMLFKYGVEALAVWVYAGALFMPWDFLNPLLTMRAELLQAGPEWLGWAMFAWSLPFLWIALSMGVRRAADAGGSPWLGLLILIPLVNLATMIILASVPSSRGAGWTPQRHTQATSTDAKSAVWALASSLLVGGLMLVVCVFLLQTYGAALFLGTPLLMGVIAAYLYNREASHGYLLSILLGGGAVLFASAALLLFALEGVICITMALPLMLPLGALGGLIGKAIADATRRERHELLAAILLLPLLAVGEASWTSTREYEVLTAVEIDAPPEVVWRHVVEFPDLPPAEAWYFRAGIASPTRARIEGRGVGATRYCEFTTGTFVEPITTWQPPRRLAFDVTEQPAPMFELSPYRHVHPPHLDGYLRSNRGEFRLIELPYGRTRLEGRTWYEFDMYPQAYWTLWSDAIIHRIHLRVLEHVKQSSMGPRPVRQDNAARMPPAALSGRSPSSDTGNKLIHLLQEFNNETTHGGASLVLRHWSWI